MRIPNILNNNKNNFSIRRLFHLRLFHLLDAHGIWTIGLHGKVWVRIWLVVSVVASKWKTQRTWKVWTIKNLGSDRSRSTQFTLDRAKNKSTLSIFVNVSVQWPVTIYWEILRWPSFYFKLGFCWKWYTSIYKLRNLTNMPSSGWF